MFQRTTPRSVPAPRLYLLTPLIACLALLAFAGPASAKPSEHPFELVPGSFHLTPSTAQAAAHEDLTTSFDIAHDESGATAGQTHNDVRTIVVQVPVGFDGNNTAVPTCTIAQLIGLRSLVNYGPGQPQCDPASQVGQISIEVAPLNKFETVTIPVFNMEVTDFGVTAEFGFNVGGAIIQELPITVRPGDNGLTVTTPNISKIGEVHKISLTIWGLPASPEHDSQRGLECFSGEPDPCETNEGHGHEEAHPVAVSIPVKPFLSNPTGCETHVASIEADSWEHPEEWSKLETQVPAMGECERVPFEPAIEVQPSTHSAESSTGLEVSLVVPQTWENPVSIATANLKDTTVALPEGMTANPSLASGLGSCTPQQYAEETSSSPPGAGCPPESKIGSIDIETPVLAERISGAIYIATPYDNVPAFGDPTHPGGSLLALYVVAKDPQRGILIKVAGKITPNPVTGQLVTTFENTPQQPFSRFTLKFRPGATAPLISPPVCGSYAATAALTPWSAPLEPRLLASSSFEVTQGVREGPCPSGGVPPFKPQVISGTQNNAGGSYSPFYLRILREDGEQELTKFTTILPPGLTGNLTGIPFCPDSAIEAARNVTGGEEEEHPSCPAASEIGHTIVEAGVGTVLAQTPGKVYLAGPYHGAPLSIVSITSAKVGPFDLGTVVIRFALDINPTTAQVEVSGAQSDPIPHIIKGIVVHVRGIRVYMDRPDFTVNPTNCSPLQITDAITGAGADPANPADQDTVNVATPFEAADCSSLQFAPKFKVTTSGKTSKALGASLTAKLTYPVAAQGTQANIKEVKVDLPKQLPSRLTTLQKACTAAQFNTNPAGCPAASNIGYAKAITPILPVPLEGPVYFVSHGGEAFPSLEIVLQGYGFTIDLVASTFISKSGVTSSTFHTVPDQPVTSFEITLPEGPYSALAANGNLCSVTKTVTVKKKVTVRVKGHKQTEARKVKESVAGSLKMPTEFTGQNGAVIHQSTPISVTGCPPTRAKARPAKKTKKRAKAKKRG